MVLVSIHVLNLLDYEQEGDLTVISAPSKHWLNLVMQDFEPSWDTYVERPSYCLDLDITNKKMVVDDYEEILLLGGCSRIPSQPLGMFITQKFAT